MLDPAKLLATVAGALESLRSPVLAATRLWVSWQFLKSGWLKVVDWETTLELFRSEYRVPLLTPGVAALAGTVGELLLPLLLIAGLLTRFAALGLFAVNILALVSYWHVLGQEGYEAARAQHLLWGYMLGIVVVFGGGRWTLDALLERRQVATFGLSAN